MQVKADGFNPLFKDYLPLYMETYGPLLKNSKDREAKLEIFLEVIGDKRLDDVKRENLDRWRAVRKKKVSGSTINREQGALRAFYNYAQENERCNKNPVRRFKKEKKPLPRDRILTKEKYGCLLENLADSPVHIYVTAGLAKNDEARRVILWEPLLFDIKVRLGPCPTCGGNLMPYLLG